MSKANNAVFESRVTGLRLLSRGKVRDMYAVDDDHLLMVVTDRLSAFDVVLPDPIPGKGEVLTDLAKFWFHRIGGLIPNHLVDLTVDDVVPEAGERDLLRGRSLVIRRVKPLPIEAIVRGYLIGSGWKDYQRTGAVSGVKLPPGLKQANRLPENIFTPSTKADVGDHDENVDFDWVCNKIGREMAEKIRDISLVIYSLALDYGLSKAIIIADTKFEFGVDDDGNLVLIDEVLTPDSSRFWPADEYRVGTSPPSFDKQFVRDYLETLDWDKKPPGPKLPAEIIEKTAARYQEARNRLMS